MKVHTTEATFNKGLIKEANTEAKASEGHKISQATLYGMRNLLNQMQHMKAPKEAGEKGALTKAINHLAHAIKDAKVDTTIPFHPLNPPIFKIRADDPIPGGGVIMKIRADEPLPVPDPKVHDKVTAKHSKEIAAAFHMVRPDTIKWQKGDLTMNTLGERYAKVAIEDHRATDGNAVYAYIPLGALTAPGNEKKVDPNKVPEFFLQILPGRGGEPMFSKEPIQLPKGIKVAPKLQEKAESIGEKVAENNGHRLSKSDAVFLRDLKPLGDNKFEAKFDVTFWMDANKVSGHITATVDGNGKLLDKGSFKSVGAHDA